MAAPANHLQSAVTTSPTPAPHRQDDPLGATLALGLRASRDGLIIGLIIALLMHGAALRRPIMALSGMQRHVTFARETLHEFFWAEYDVNLLEEKKKEEKKPEEEPEPEEPEPEEQVVPPPIEKDEPTEPEPPDDDPYEDDEPPPPSEASDVLAMDDGDAVDLSGDGWTIVDKDGSKNTGSGFTSSKGTVKGPVTNKNAKVGGKPGGTGKGKPKPPKKKNLSRPPQLTGSRSWDCPFPAQADTEQVDRATAVVSVTIGANGRAIRAQILSDPGYGFGRAAQRCAMAKRYKPARNADGRPITATTPPIRVRFSR
jgi:protein TonB